MNEFNLIRNGLPARHSPSGKIRIVVISTEENQTGLWDHDDFNRFTGQVLTREIVDDCYVEADSVCLPTKFEIKVIPAIFRVNQNEEKHYC